MKQITQLLFLFFSLILTATSFAQNQNDVQERAAEYKYIQPDITNQFESKISEYIFFDNHFNVSQRLRTEQKAKENLMSEQDKLPVVIDLFEVDLNKIKDKTFISKYITEQDLSRVVRDNKLYIPSLKSDHVSNLALRAQFGSPRLQTVGRKVLSRATYYVEPVGSIGGFFAKFVPHVPGLEQKLEREILVNDYVKSQLSELPQDMRRLTMDSFMALNLSVMGVPIAVAYRSADRIVENKGAGIKTFPGHGLLGCDACVTEYAMKFTQNRFESDKAVDRWKTEELLPKLARYMAYANHVLGVSFESHTQNMIFDIDTTTGKIKEIYLRDFADVLLNPIPLLAAGLLPNQIEWERVKLMSVHGNYFSDQGVAIAKDIWYHASIYSGQGITSHISGFQRQQRHLKVFLEAYIKSTEQILNQPIELKADAKRVMNELEQKVAKDKFYSGELQERSPLRNAMASVLKPIFEQVFLKSEEKINQELKYVSVDSDQKRVSQKFQKLLSGQRVVFLSENAKEFMAGEDTKYTWFKNTLNAYVNLGLPSKKLNSEIVFKIHDGRIWAVDGATNKVLAVTIESVELKTAVSQNQFLQKAASFFKKPADVLLCRDLF